MENTVEQNPTPDQGGASTLDPLDRIEALLQGAESGSDEGQGESQDQPAQQDVEPDGDGQQSAEPQLSTSDLAKLLKLEENALDLDEEGNAVFKTKIDGKEGTAKLQDLLKSYQLQEHVDRKSREAAEREKAIQAREKDAEQQYQQKLQQAENLSQVALNQLHAEFRSIDWNGLMTQDPGRAALLRQQYIERDAQIRSVLQNIDNEKAQAKAKQDEQEKTRYQAEMARLPQAIPAWVKDGQFTEAYLKESGEIQSLATKRGVNPDVLKAITQGAQFDAGLVSIIRDGLMYQKMQQDKAAVENRVRQAPRLVKPGTQAVNSQADKLQSMKTAVKKSGGRNGTIEEFLIASGKV